MTYRPDIDGLRALAVLPVVFFHAGMWPFTGGFVGVDIFFVISGYLITGIIISGVAEGSFSLLGFYRRRLLRIAPAAVAMALTTVVVGMIVLPPAELRLLGNSLIAAIASLANVYFWGSAGYFDAASESKPLLHLWSLSVEEQFYLLFPIVLVALHRWGKTTAFWGIALLALCSLAWSQHAALTDPAAAFYSLQSRAFELLIGSLLAMGRTNTIPRPAGAGAAALGLILVGVGVFGFQKWTPFPGLAAVIPCAGTALLLWAGRCTPGNAVSRLLGTRPLRSIGLISYSLYLWHWPILVFYAIIVDRALLPSEVAVAITAALLASLLSWRFVEQPFRDGRRPAKSSPRPAYRIRVVTALAVLTVGAGSGAAIRLYDGFPQRAPAQALAANAAMAVSPLVDACLSSNGAVPEPDNCVSGATTRGDGGYEVVVWGDSFAEHIFPAVAIASAADGHTARLIGMSACPPLLDAMANRVGEPGFAARCLGFNRRVVELISAEPDKKLIVLSGNWAAWTSGQDFFLSDAGNTQQATHTGPAILAASLSRTVSALKSLGHEVMIIRSPPSFSWDPPQCAARAAMLGRDTAHCFTIAAAPVLTSLEPGNEMIDGVVRRWPEVTTFDPAAFLCDTTACSAISGDTILFRNSDHLSVAGSAWLASFLSLPQSGGARSSCSPPADRRGAACAVGASRDIE